MYCSNCGKELRQGDQFCSNCGNFCHNQERKNETNSNENNHGNISLIMGIIACIFCWLPFLSIPLSIVAIIIGKRHKKATGEKTAGTTLGFISIILSFIEIILIVFLTVDLFNFIESELETDQSLKEIYEQIEEYNKENNELYDAETPFDISGYSWVGNDNSVLYLHKNKGYVWYQDDTTQTDNFYTGTYDFYTGTEAINYIANTLKQYNITAEEQNNLIQNSGYKLNDYYVIILNCNQAIINGVEQPNANSTVYYYGFYDETRKYLDLVNINTSNQGKFTQRDKISNIDI